MKPPQANLQHLISFYFVARMQSFTSAADILCLTQPAVTLHLKSLENQFGVKLFTVKKQKVYLTEQGDKLFGHVKRILEHVTEAEEYLRSQRQNHFRIGVAFSATLHVTPIIERFKEVCPGVCVTIREASSRDLLDELIDFKHDLCLIGSLTRIPSGLRVFETPDSDEMVFVASPGHAILRRAEISWEELVKYPLILQREGSASREKLLNYLQERGLSPNIDTVVDNIESAKRFAKENKAVAFMFGVNAEREIAHGELARVPLIGDTIRVGTDVIIRDDSVSSPLIIKFLKTIEEMWDFEIL